MVPASVQTPFTVVRTLEDALELLRTHLVVTEVPAHGTPSLVEAVVGGPLAGSWREHAKGRLIYRLGRQLRASPQVLAVRLVEGKVAFVHPALWPEVYRVAMEPTRRRASLAGLSPRARALLEVVERDGELRLERSGPWTKEREVLEARLLVHSAEEQGLNGAHRAVLRSWRAWAPPALERAAAALSYGEALARLEHASGGAPAGLGPWVY
ncbi:MAG: RNA methyltransferase [Myxococcaceae bacterium]|nr:RNA methyltransferase [Myxococcaceae bacterium]MCI0669099.1 RNA methyltransferase [Myxococcaceae bacterium]